MKYSLQSSKRFYGYCDLVVRITTLLRTSFTDILKSSSFLTLIYAKSLMFCLFHNVELAFSVLLH